MSLEVSQSPKTARSRKSDVTPIMLAFAKDYMAKKEDLSLYGSSNVELEKEMTELEAVLALIKSQRIEEQRALSSAKDQEAIYRIQYDELTSLERSFENATGVGETLELSATGTEADSDHLEHHLDTLTQQRDGLKTEVTTLQNDAVIMRKEREEIEAETAETTAKIADYRTETPQIEERLSQLQQEKVKLVSRLDDVRIAIANKETENQPKNTVNRGNAGLAEYDEYIKRLRHNLDEARDQKRNCEHQHIEISQRLDAKRRLLELADKNRVTDKTMELTFELRTQLAFMDQLKTCIEVFYDAQQPSTQHTLAQLAAAAVDVSFSAIKTNELGRIRQFRHLLEQVRDSICNVQLRLTPALQSEQLQFHEMHQRLKQQISSKDAKQERFSSLDARLLNLNTSVPFAKKLIELL